MKILLWCLHDLSCLLKRWSGSVLGIAPRSDSTQEANEDWRRVSVERAQKMTEAEYDNLVARINGSHG